MRMSCNGCRVLRKGCGGSCVLRPCLQWIQSAEAQANATIFLAKFYGRAGLLNLIGDGPAHLRPAIFRSLLYEACGRAVNPTYGSVGLLLSGNWKSCEAGVENILQGRPVYPPHSNLPNDTDIGNSPDRERCDHPARNSCLTESIAKELRGVKSRRRFKCAAHGRRRGGSPKPKAVMADAAQSNRHSNASSSESDRREDDDRYNSCESDMQVIDMICNAPKVEDEYHLRADEVELELRLGSPCAPNDCKSYPGNAAPRTARTVRL